MPREELFLLFFFMEASLLLANHFSTAIFNSGSSSTFASFHLPSLPLLADSIDKDR